MSSGLQRPMRRCTAPGCTSKAEQGPHCTTHAQARTAQKWNTPTKRTGIYHSKEYHRERQAVKRDRGSCHLFHVGPCNGTLHYHSTRPPSHAREVCAFLCEHHHMSLEAQGKDGVLARALEQVMQHIRGEA